MYKATRSGFTLIELMIVVAIIAILAAIAYPSYSRYGFRTRRAEAKELLMRLTAAQEQHLAAFNSYAFAIDTAPTATPSGLGLSTALTSENGYYNISLTTAAGGLTYSLTATPSTDSIQASDACGSLSIDNALNKTYSGNQTNGSCW